MRYCVVDGAVHLHRICRKGSVAETSVGLKSCSRQRAQATKLNYYPDTDSLYIDLSEQPSVESREIAEGIVLDYDAARQLVGIDIDNASRKVELKQLTLSKLPLVVQTISA